ncbi:diacylglycerol/lipid kinase family protein [Ciceribacter thiooxidans]|uniref:Diacylglycerol/lipid kinase family protein n=1 Tax=Ciceribacter thiooxidans TaxID=1969821 RepID=A0ABV7I357_9HYPH|nr:diacylglycerol kinase family protein [Ciceribacter thiooxidans]
MRIRAIFNRDGGTFKTADMTQVADLATDVFSARGHEFECLVVSGSEILPALAAAVRDTDALIAGGGDGTISAAAGVAWKAGLPLGVVPAGTMNLFARSLRIPLDLGAALETLAASPIRAVDIASVNGRPFVHQFSAGLHARMVRMREAKSYASRLGKIRASVRAALGVMLKPPRFEVVFDLDHDGRNERRIVSAISISNNPFGERPLFFADELTGGKLGVYLADALEPWGVAKLAFDIARGRMKENAAVTAATAETIRLHFPRHPRGAHCVVDGELVRMPDRLEVRIHPGELQVLAPPALPDT